MLKTSFAVKVLVSTELMLGKSQVKGMVWEQEGSRLVIKMIGNAYKRRRTATSCKHRQFVLLYMVKVIDHAECAVPAFTYGQLLSVLPNSKTQSRRGFLRVFAVL